MAHLIHSILPDPPRPIAVVHPDLLIEQCVDMMVSQNIGALVVTDDDNVLGILSERDLVRSCLYKGLDPKVTRVSDVISAKVTVLSPHDTVEKAMQMMTSTKRRHILVEDEGRLVAIVSIGDLVFSMLQENARQIEHLENYIQS